MMEENKQSRISNRKKHVITYKKNIYPIYSRICERLESVQ